MNARLCSFSVFVGAVLATPLLAEDRTIDGTGNHLTDLTRGAANTPFIRHKYSSQFFGGSDGLPTETQRPSARTISSAVSAQSVSRPSARNLSNYIWAWGQFLTHDTDLTTTSDGPTINGTAPIPVNAPGDPLGPNPIPFTRANFVNISPPPRGSTSGRTPVNEVTSFIDASNVYGSDASRAAALRTNGGTGPKLLTDAHNLLPRNGVGLANENEGPVPGDQLFLAGDIRSNENSLLTSLHTLFAREHNRLVDRIAAREPHLNDEQQYQLARKLVGAEMQAITYREFLPALLGTGASVPKAEQYVYQQFQVPTITTAHSHAAFRFGHSAVTSQLKLVDTSGAPAGSLALRDVFFNPNLIGDDPALVDKLLQGAAAQVSEEIDTLVIDDLRNFLFGPPGAGGLDLASLNIQRGRDVGVPSFTMLSGAFAGGNVSNFSQLTSDPNLAQTLQTLYGTPGNMDAWVGGLAQNHVAGASVGALFKGVFENQFLRLRDGDRLFYRGNVADLYESGTLKPDIAALVDLDHLTLADVIKANTSINHLQDNIFFVPAPGDFNGDGIVDTADYIVWRTALGTANVWADADGSGAVGPEDLDIWRANFGNGTPASAGSSALAQIPEPSAAMSLLLLTILHANSRGLTACRRVALCLDAAPKRS